MANPHSAHRAVEGDIRQPQRRARGVDANNVGIVLFVRRKHQRNHLGLIAEALGKQRANRPIDLAASQHFALARPAFALDKSAGNASAGISVLAVVHGQGEKIDAFAGIGGSYRGCQYYGIALAHQRGTGGLLGHPSGFKMQLLAAGKLDGHVVFHKFPHLSVCSQSVSSHGYYFSEERTNAKSAASALRANSPPSEVLPARSLASLHKIALSP